MLKIICPVCSKETVFKSNSSKPDKCFHCDEVFETSINVLEINEELPVKSLMLTYQKDLQKIEIPLGDKIILGRNSFGSEVFSKILYNGKPVISGLHCSIEFTGGKIYVKDENSSNGTFIGTSLDKVGNARVLLEDNDLLFLGREPFFVQYVYESSKQVDVKTSVSEESTISNKKNYRCNSTGCGYESETYSPYCPKCETFGSLK